MPFDKVYGRRPARVPRQVGLQEAEASWKPLAKGTALLSYGCSTEIEVPSQQSAFFISYCTD